jgi:hypothetical protein
LRKTQFNKIAFSILVVAGLGLGVSFIDVAHADPLSNVAATRTRQKVTARKMPSVVPFELNEDARNLMYLRTKDHQSSKAYRPVRRPPRQQKYLSRYQSLAPESQTSFPSAAMSSSSSTFAGLSYQELCSGGQCGSGWPPDTNGEVGPNHYIQAVNTAYAIYDKSSGQLLASFTEDQLWSSSGSTACNGYSQGDPVIVYDPLADRWILANFAFASSAGPFYECIAVSKTSDPVSGGWWLYELQMDPGGTGLPPAGTMNDYSKFGIWPDCLFMSANEVTPTGDLSGTLVAAFDRASLESGGPLNWKMIYLPFTSYQIFGMLPSNLLGSSPSSLPATGTPNYFISEGYLSYGFEVREFDCSAGTFTTDPVFLSTADYYYNFGDIVPQAGTSLKLDIVDDRLMQKLQYRKTGTTESLWLVHNIMTAPSSSVMPEWAQINVTGGSFSLNQYGRFAPADSVYRWMGSLAADKDGNMALGYSTSSSSTYPGIAYTGRVSSDILGTLPQGETQLVAGGGSQTNNCGGGPCDRWGDYSSMSVDPSDDCTFWYTNEYYDSTANGSAGNWHTLIGSFRFDTCNAGDLVRKGSGGSYASIGSAYSSLTGTDALFLQSITFYESPVLNNSSDLTLYGGYNSAFTSNTGFSAVHGSITISGTGSVIIDKLSIQ